MFILNHIENPKIPKKHVKRFAFFEGQMGNPRSGSPDPPGNPRTTNTENHADGPQQKTENTFQMGLDVKNKQSKNHKTITTTKLLLRNNTQSRNVG